MKTLNPWVIVRWAFVALLYVATIVVAMDQVKMARSGQSAAERKADSLQVAKLSKDEQMRRYGVLLDEANRAVAYSKEDLERAKSGPEIALAVENLRMANNEVQTLMKDMAALEWKPLADNK
jgi:hypothetical protein